MPGYHSETITPDDTAIGLMEYFMDSVMYAHPEHYPEQMTREQFVEQLDEYREGMNMTNNCQFPELNDEQIDKIFADYQEWLETWNY